MELIRSVEIERFRSCESVSLQDLGAVTALVGPNNSGKSNVLRALNLFFNDETEPGLLVDFDVDYRLRAPSNKKKSIRICVEFSLPDKFRFRKRLEPVEQLLGRSFSIRKTWTLDLSEPGIELRCGDGEFRRVVGDEADRVTQFLNLVSFRYVPNRAIPAQVIREESRGVLRQLARRLLARGGRDVTPILEDMTSVAREMVAPIADDLIRVSPGMSDLELSTPAGVFDFFGQAGFRAGVGAFGHVEDTSLGSGVQSILMFHVLHMIDQGQFQGFGWKQAAIWAVEEPESSLHRQLQVRLAILLRGYAVAEDSRFQVLVTTHNDVFVSGATTGYLVTLDESPATTTERRPVVELAQDAASKQITAVPGPALHFPIDTVVLTEGEIDARVLAHAANLRGVCEGVQFSTPSQLDESLGSDGIDAVKRFVANHGHMLRQRLSGYPLLVLVDWEVGDGSVQQIAKKYGEGAALYVRKMDSRWADPLVGDSFKGIERFYAASFLERAEQKTIISLARRQNRGFVVTPRDLANAKARLAELFCQTATPAECQNILPALEWVESARSGGLL